MHSVTDWKRLYAALAVSCLVHAALVLAPYHGTGATDADSPAAAGRALQPRTAQSLDVRLERARGPAATAGAPASSSKPSHGSGRLPIAAPTYYRTDQLTRPPRPTSQPKLDVPRKVARAVTGKVQLRLWIDELGGVESVEVESSNLPKSVTELAAGAFRQLRFVPGEIDGVRVRTLMMVEVDYSGGRRPPP